MTESAKSLEGKATPRVKAARAVSWTPRQGAKANALQFKLIAVHGAQLVFNSDGSKGLVVVLPEQAD